MYNPYLPKFAKIKKIQKESLDTKLFTFQFLNPADRENFSFQHGQYLMAGVLNFGEAPFDICSSTVKTDIFQLSIRKVGSLTEKFYQLKVGDLVTIRGPFGNGFPVEKFKNRNLLLIGCGCGFVTLRSLILDYLANKLNPQNKMQVFYGCLNEENLLYKKEYKTWQKKVDLAIVLEKPLKKWKGTKGVITILFDKIKLVEKPVAIIVGPPIMYKFVIEELTERGVADSDIYLSLERRMYCGIGVCQHCAIGSYYVCKDGPVFNWEELKNIPSAV